MFDKRGWYIPNTGMPKHSELVCPPCKKGDHTQHRVEYMDRNGQNVWKCRCVQCFKKEVR